MPRHAEPDSHPPFVLIGETGSFLDNQGQPLRLSDAFVADYWRQVEDILSRAFQVDGAPRAVRAARHRLDDPDDPPPANTRLYFYHATPLQVAADIARIERELTQAELEIAAAVMRGMAQP